MLLTISIPTHNSANYLDEALQSIIKEPGLCLLYEITLSDNSLTSDTENLYRDKYINHKGRPYTLNSSFIEFESPPLNLVFLLNLISHTFSNVRATIKFTSIVKKAIRQNYKK